MGGGLCLLTGYHIGVEVVAKEKVYAQLPIHAQRDLSQLVDAVEREIIEWTNTASLVKIEKNVGVTTIHTRTKSGQEVVVQIRMDILTREA